MSRTPGDKKTYIAVTIDVDPDVNLAVKGRVDAVSHPFERGEVRLDSCVRGLKSIVDILGRAAVSGTFFLEARTLETISDSSDLDLAKLLKVHEVGSHALKHEDFLGKESGVPMNKEEILATLRGSLDIIRKTLGRSPRGFRAPYIRLADMLASAVAETGFEYDSSVTRSFQPSGVQDHIFRPYYYFEESEMEINNPGALVEVPLPEIVTPEGKKTTSYLWPFIEGDLPFSRIINAFELVANTPPSNSIFLIGLHPWHLIETFKHGILNEKRQEEISGQILNLITGLNSKAHIEFITISEYLDLWHSWHQGNDLADVMGKN